MSFQELVADFPDSLQQFALPVAVLVVVLGLSMAYFRISSPEKATKSIDNSNKDKSQPPNFTAMAPAPANDVWAERRKRGIAASSTSKKENASQEKPFGSSYYYAHNSTKNKGGYSDGLRMEDFTMNGPRLLSKNGVSAEAEPLATSANNDMDENVPAEKIQQRPASVTPPRKRSTPITKYLWDDPGDASGIATIRIEVLPCNHTTKKSNETVDWKDAKIRNVSAKLEGEGLLVIATDEEERDYRLHIPKLYDRATEVRTVVKAKRLLVKIHKKRNGINIGGKSNLEPWPQPQKPSYKVNM